MSEKTSRESGSCVCLSLWQSETWDFTRVLTGQLIRLRAVLVWSPIFNGADWDWQMWTLVVQQP